jgi:anti-repressor protein
MNMNELKIFKNEEFGQIRVIPINDEPWFVGKDVAVVLGYVNPRKAIGDHEEDRMDGVTIRDSIGREQSPVLINESGLYSLILSSKLPNAKRFKRWVTSEVLPSIRKHGVYMTDNVLDRILDDPTFLYQVLTELHAEQMKRQALEQKLIETEPKTQFADAVHEVGTTILVGELAKLLKQNGIETGQNRLYAWLRDHGYLIGRKGIDYNMPTQKSMDMELFTIRETVIRYGDGSEKLRKTTRVTGKGQLYFIGLFLGEQEV